MVAVKRALLVTILVIACGFMAWRIAGNWHTIDWTLLRFRPLFLLAATATFFLAWEPIGGLRIKVLFDEFGHRISWWDAILTDSSAQVAKYVPGGVWYATARALVAERFAIPKAVSFTSAVVDSMFIVSGAATILLLATVSPWGMAVFTGLLCIVGTPALVLIGMAVVRKIFKGKIVAVVPSYRKLVYLSLLYVGIWLIEAATVYFLIASFYPLALTTLPRLTVAWAWSWTIGLIVPFAPGGLGIRDPLFAVLLTPVLPVAMGGIVAVASRLWLLACEAIASGMAWMLLKGRGRSDTISSPSPQEAVPVAASGIPGVW